MSQQNINTDIPNSGNGDALRDAFLKTQNNFTELYGNKVDKVSGKGLSTNDYTTAEKNKLAGIPADAEKNVQADFLTNDTNSDSYIKNKPPVFSGVSWGQITGTLSDQEDLQNEFDSLPTFAYVDSKITQTVNSGITDFSPSENAVFNALLPKENKSEKNLANGYAGLDGAGKILTSQLPSSIMEYKGVYNATTNVPTLVNGSGDTGDVYRCTVSGSGVNSLNFVVGDYAVYNGTTWEKQHSGADNVVSVFGRAGVVTAQTGDYTTAQITEVTNKRFQTDNQNTFNDATSSIQTQLNGKQANLGFTPENVANKAIVLTTSNNTLYPSVLAVNNGLATKVDETFILNTTAPLIGGGDLSTNRTIAIPAATTSVNGYLTSTDWNTFNNKLGSITGVVAGGELAGTYPNPTLTNAGVIGKVLTGYVSGAGTVAATDTILQGFNKLNGNIATKANTAITISTTAPLTGGGDLSTNRTIAIPAATTSINGYLTSTDWATFNSKLGTISGIAAGGDLAGTYPNPTLVDSAVVGSILTGYASGAGTVAATDTILQAIQKLNGNAATNANLTGEVTSVGNVTTVPNTTVIGKVLTGYASGAGTVAATDTILQAVNKLNGNDALKAPLASPPFTGVPTAPTAADGTNTIQLATTTFVQNTVGGYLNKTGLTGGTITLTDAEVSNAIMSFAGTLTANLTVTVPITNNRLWAVYNNTTGAFTVTVKTVAGAGVTVAQTKRNLVYTNGVDVLDGFTDFESIAITGIPTAPTASVGTSTTQLATTAFVNAEIANDAPTKTGGGASGTWGIGITGNAGTVTTNANLTGEVTSVGNVTTIVNSAVIGSTITGYVSGAGTVAATDTILQAVNKLNGNDLLKAPLASPALTGVPTAPTASVDTNTTQLATTAYVIGQGYAKSSTIGNGTLTLNVGGSGLSGSASFTANQAGATTFTVTSNATSVNTASTIVSRDASGNFNAGNVQATTFNGVKLYKATVIQAGTSAPTSNVIANSLGGTPVWTRTGVGTYNITLSGVFTSNKVNVQMTNGLGSSNNVYSVLSTSTIAIYSAINSGTLQDDLLNISLVIEVYP